MAHQQGPYGPQQPHYGPPPGYGYPSPPPPKRGRSPLFWVFAVGLPLVLLFSCTVAVVAIGGQPTISASPGETRIAQPQPVATSAESTQQQPAATPPAEQSQETAPAQQEQTAPAETAAAETAESKPAPPEKVALPNVVGMNLQAGQDTMQAAGFYFLDDQDDTGQHRLQVYDRNWVVTRQEPPAGRKVPTSTKVILWAKKIGE